MIKNIIYYFASVSILFPAITVEDLKIFYDKENISQHLYRPKINSNNSYLSAEIHTHMIDASNKINKDNTIIFKLNERSKAYHIQNYKNCLVEWSPIDILDQKSSEIFYSSKRDCEEFKDSNCKKLTEKIEWNIINTFKLDSCIIHNGDLEADIEPGLFQAESIIKYKLSIPANKEIEIQKNDYGYNRPIIHVLFDDKNIDGYNLNFKTNHSFQKPLINMLDFSGTIIDFDVAMTNDNNNRYIALLNEIHSTYQSRVYLNVLSEKQKSLTLPLYPPGFENADQIEPKFNHDGTKASFLSFQPNSNGHFQLYVFDLETKNRWIDFILSNNKNPENIPHKMIDDYIVNDDYKDGYPNQRFTSYCWHPNKNILFYIKREEINNENPIKNYSIYYYDLDTNEGPQLLDIPTNYNSYLSMSNDGEYLLFSFTSLKDGSKNKDVFSNSKNIRYNSYNKIGLAKLAYE